MNIVFRNLQFIFTRSWFPLSFVMRFREILEYTWTHSYLFRMLTALSWHVRVLMLKSFWKRTLIIVFNLFIWFFVFIFCNFRREEGILTVRAIVFLQMLIIVLRSGVNASNKLSIPYIELFSCFILCKNISYFKQGENSITNIFWVHHRAEFFSEVKITCTTAQVSLRLYDLFTLKQKKQWLLLCEHCA